jgi:hypothetical protein
VWSLAPRLDVRSAQMSWTKMTFMAPASLAHTQHQRITTPLS